MKLSFSPCKYQINEDPRKIWKERNSLQNSREIIKVSAKVSDLKAWKNLENIVDFGFEIPLDKNEWSVTAKIWSDQYQEILNQSFVKVLEISSEVIGPTGSV